MSILNGSLLYLGYLLAFVGAALACFGAAYRALQIPHAGTRHSLFVFFLTSGGWAATYVAFLVSKGPVPKNIVYLTSLIVGFGTVWAWLWFCSAYTGRSLHQNATIQTLAAIIFGIVVLLKLTNPVHALYYTLEPASTEGFGLVVRHGLLYWVVMGVSYALAVAGYLMLFELFVRTGNHTGPLAGLTLLTGLPAALNIIGYASPALQDLTHEPLGVAVFAVGVLFVYHYHFRAVQLAGSTSAPTIVLGQDGHIKDFGQKTADLFPILEDPTSLGAPLEAVLPTVADRLGTDQPPLELQRTSGPQFFQVLETDFGGQGGDGHRVILLADVTERERRQRALQNRQEKVEALYSAVSQLIRTRNREEIERLVVNLINDVFGYPYVGIRFAREDALVLTQRSPQVEEHMPLPPEMPLDQDSLVARAFRTGEPVTVRDVNALDDSIDHEKVRGAAVFPIEGRGIISVGKMQPGEIDPFDQHLIEVLAVHTGMVLNRIDREQALREAKEEAQTASQMKSALLANVGHEIRTPLTSIIGFAEGIETEISERTQLEKSPIGTHAELIEKSGRRLLGTLEGVLNLSKLEAGQMALDARPVDLSATAHHVAEELRPKAREEDIHLQLETESAWATADQDGVQIVARNLLSNAIKYTEAGGTVWIRSYRDEQSAVLEVEDTGIGIEPEMVDHLFEPFRQASEGVDRQYEGTGVGLTVTKEATEQMDGSLEVESEEGKGSRFTVRLPLEEMERTEEPA